MDNREIATWKSTVEIFGKYTQIFTKITFNKDVIKSIENNKRLKRSLKSILRKYEREEIANCICCSFSLLYNKNTSTLKGAIISEERVCKDEKEANSVVKDQEKVVKSIVKLLKTVKRIDNRKVRRSITRIFKNDRRVQIHTRFVLSTREYYEVKEQYQEINNFILELVSDYKYERNENLMFRWKLIYEAPFGCEISLFSFIDVKSYNKRLAIVNKHKQVVKLAEKFWKNEKEEVKS